MHRWAGLVIEFMGLLRMRTTLYSGAGLRGVARVLRKKSCGVVKTRKTRRERDERLEGARLAEGCRSWG